MSGKVRRVPKRFKFDTFWADEEECKDGAEYLGLGLPCQWLKSIYSKGETVYLPKVADKLAQEKLWQREVENG
ncbi:conserved hypothetical protein [Ricinus communis]|uniref:Uncharacterized protein n=1 Tax=Ricinus communis TaxID=3988 RepID=B9T4E9_RICCO|nr:conserved hypothetical protein [Ricinus communis]